MLPPSAVRLALRSREGSQTELHAAGAGAAGAGEGGNRAAPVQQPRADGGTAGPGAEAAGAAAAVVATAREPGGSRKKSGSWWRRLYRKKGLQWGDYRIGALATLCFASPAELLCWSRICCRRACTLRRHANPCKQMQCCASLRGPAASIPVQSSCRRGASRFWSLSIPRAGRRWEVASLPVRALLCMYVCPPQPARLRLAGTPCRSIHARCPPPRRAGGRISAPPLPAGPAPAPGARGALLAQRSCAQPSFWC